MTVFITHCCKKYSGLLAVALLCWAVVGLRAAHAEAIEVRSAALAPAEDGYALQADFDIALNATLEDALNKGVSLYFLVEFELIRPRWYWLNEKVVETKQQYRLSYNALTRQYRLAVGGLFQNFATLSEALTFLSRVRMRQLLEPGALRKDNTYIAAVRMRLDLTQLPKPFQVNALASRDWNIASDWLRWTVPGGS